MNKHILTFMVVVVLVSTAYPQANQNNFPGGAGTYPNPGASIIGNPGAGFLPFACISDGGNTKTMAQCITHCNAQIASINSCNIYGQVTEDLDPRIFSSASFAGTIVLNVNDKAATRRHCSNSAPFGCWLTKGPLIIPSSLRVVGSGGTYDSNTCCGTAVSFDTSTNVYPSAIGPPTNAQIGTPTVGTTSCGGCTGTIGTQSNGVIIGAEFVNNAMQNAGTPATPMFGRPFMQVLPSSSFNGCGSNNCWISMSIPAFASLSTGHGLSSNSAYSAQDVAFFTSQVAAVFTGVSCSGSHGRLSCSPSSGNWGGTLGVGEQFLITGCSSGVGTPSHYNSSNSPTGDWIVYSGGGATNTITAWDTSGNIVGGTDTCTNASVYVESQPIENAGSAPTRMTQDMVCPNGGGTVDVLACSGGTTSSWTAGTAYIEALAPVNGTPGANLSCRLAPNKGNADGSNPLILMQFKQRGCNSSATSGAVFAGTIENLSVRCDPTLSHDSTTFSQTPHIGVMATVAEENAGLRNVQIFGPCVDSMLYVSGTDSSHEHVSISSASGPQGGNNNVYNPVIVDCARFSYGCPRLISDMSANGENNTGTKPNMIGNVVVYGNKYSNTPGPWPTLVGIHGENGNEPAIVQSGIVFTQGASGAVHGAGMSGTLALTISPTAGHVDWTNITGTTTNCVNDQINNVLVPCGPNSASVGGSTNFQVTGSLTTGTSVWTSGPGVPRANCAVGSIYTNTQASSASTVMYVCYPANTWKAVVVP